MSEYSAKPFECSESPIKVSSDDKNKVPLEPSDKLKNEKTNIPPLRLPTKNKVLEDKKGFVSDKLNLSTDSSSSSDNESSHHESFTKSSSKQAIQNEQLLESNDKVETTNLKARNSIQPITVLNSEKSISEDDLNMQLQLSDDDEEAKELDKEMEIDNPSSNISSPDNNAITGPDDCKETLESK